MAARPPESVAEIVISQSAPVSAPPQTAFAAVAGLDAPSIFRARGPVPGVVGVEGHIAPWSAVGQTRTIRLSDGSSVHETLTAFGDGALAYKVTDFEGAFGRLAREARGEWRVTPHGDGARIEWRYVFTPASPLAALPLRVIAFAFWADYMRAALSRLKTSIETAAPAP
jgi:hypothetical protein